MKMVAFADAWLVVDMQLPLPKKNKTKQNCSLVEDMQLKVWTTLTVTCLMTDRPLPLPLIKQHKVAVRATLVVACLVTNMQLPMPTKHPRVAIVTDTCNCMRSEMHATTLHENTP